MKCLEIARLQDFAPAPNTQGLLGALSGPQTPNLPYRTNSPLKISAYRPALFYDEYPLSKTIRYALLHKQVDFRFTVNMVYCFDFFYIEFDVHMIEKLTYCYLYTYTSQIHRFGCFHKIL